MANSPSQPVSGPAAQHAPSTSCCSPAVAVSPATQQTRTSTSAPSRATPAQASAARSRLAAVVGRTTAIGMVSARAPDRAGAVSGAGSGISRAGLPRHRESVAGRSPFIRNESASSTTRSPSSAP